MIREEAVEEVTILKSSSDLITITINITGSELELLTDFDRTKHRKHLNVGEMRNHLKLLNDPVVTLRIDESELHVHRNLLCKASPVFEAAFTGENSFVETRTQIFEFDSSEVSIESLELLVQWLYSDDYKLPEAADIFDVHERYTELADLYVFAEKYVIVDLKHSIIEEFWKLQKKKSPRLIPIRRIYENTPDSSPCRLLIAAGYAWNMSMTWYDKESASERLRCHPDFGADVAIELGKRFSGNHQNPFSGKASDFYTADERKRKSKKKADCGNNKRMISLDELLSEQSDDLL